MTNKFHSPCKLTLHLKHHRTKRFVYIPLQKTGIKKGKPLSSGLPYLYSMDFERSMRLAC